MRISKKRLAVLRKLESIVANSCYNANIQNWGPNGAFYGEGRSFRYPITFTDLPLNFHPAAIRASAISVTP